MSRDITDIIGEYLSDDPSRWAKLASEITYRRLHLLLLRELVLELRKLNERTQQDQSTATSPPDKGG